MRHSATTCSAASLPICWCQWRPKIWLGCRLGPKAHATSQQQPQVVICYFQLPLQSKILADIHQSLFILHNCKNLWLFLFLYLSFWSQNKSLSEESGAKRAQIFTEQFQWNSLEFFNGQITARSLLVEATAALGLSTSHTTQQIRA